MSTTGNQKLIAANQHWPDKSHRIVLFKTEWNSPIVDELEAGALRILQQLGYANVEAFVVPGAVEITHAIKAVDASPKKAAAYIAFACVVRGDTPHFDYVCQSITDGITQLNLLLNAPVIYGVLTVNTEEQAYERIGGKHGHKGEEAAITALKMLALKEGLAGGGDELNS